MKEAEEDMEPEPNEAWKPLFSVKEFKKDKEEATLDDFKLNSEALKEYGVEISNIRHELRAVASQFGNGAVDEDDVINQSSYKLLKKIEKGYFKSRKSDR